LKTEILQKIFKDAILRSINSVFFFSSLLFIGNKKFIDELNAQTLPTHGIEDILKITLTECRIKEFERNM